MRHIDLREHERSELSYTLAAGERRELREILSLTIDPSEQDTGYHLTPGSTVGAVQTDDLSVLVEPKIGIPKLLSLACYAIGAFKPRDEDFDFAEEEALPDILALSLTTASRRAFRRGLLHGYLTEDETLYGIRGRVRFDDQLRRRFGLPIPIEVRYDEFTNDILANRLVRAAAARLTRMRIRSKKARRELGWVTGMLSEISLVEFPPGNVPSFTFDRLNEHYRAAVRIAQLILRHTAFQSDRGRVRASGFVVNMNNLFEEFVTRALREALRVSDHTFRKVRPGDGVTLDKKNIVGLEPDLSWWDGGVCRFVGDAKYKRTSDRRVPNADLYQLLAYTTALDLTGGMLIYARGEAAPLVHEVRHLGKRLEVAALDLSGTLDQILVRIEEIADKIKAMRQEVRAPRPAA